MVLVGSWSITSGYDAKTPAALAFNQVAIYQGVSPFSNRARIKHKYGTDIRWLHL
jgi:hypothetical protein